MGYLKPGQSKDERNGRNGMREGRQGAGAVEGSVLTIFA
jgi:hypothetical protein